jgi:ferredoxin-NADP reductase
VTETEADLPGKAATLHWQPASITAIVRQTSRVSSFFLAPTHPFAFEAGQHVDVRLTAPDGYQAERSYSIASSPGGAADPIELAIERLDEGEVSPYFHDVAVLGDSIELRGPIGGHFVWKPEDGGPLLLLGGGSGVVPLMSMLRHRAARGSTLPALLLVSARQWDDILFREELLALQDRRDGLILSFALTRDRVRRPGDFERRIDAGMVAALLKRLPAPPSRVFVCGANPFVSAAADAAIEAGLDAALIRTERYGQ